MKTLVTKGQYANIVLENEKSLRLVLSNFGASIYSIELKNQEGIYEAMTLHPADMENFYNPGDYHGKTIGRFAGRINKGLCEINSKQYTLDINWNGVNSLHGGFKGINGLVFDYELVEGSEYTDVIFRGLEKAGNLPGDVTYKVTYRVYNLTDDIDLYLEADTTEDTIVNLTNHVYLNLSGDCKDTILDHKLYLACDKYTRLNNELITITVDPVNEIMDFTDNHEIKKYINDDSLQNFVAGGYDHCFIKTDTSKDLIAVVTNPANGVSLSIETSYPTVVFYSGNFLDNYPFNKERLTNIKHQALCLEPQFIPNGINMSGEDSAILRKGEHYSQFIKYKFQNN